MHLSSNAQRRSSFSTASTIRGVMWSCCEDQGSNQFSLSLSFKGKQQDLLGRLQDQLDRHPWGWVIWVCPPLVVVGVTFSRCPLDFCGVCAGTGLLDTPNLSLGRKGRCHGLWRLPGGFGTLSYAQVGVNPTSTHLERLVSSPEYKLLLGSPVTPVPRGCSTFAACAQAAPANELFVFLSLCQHYFFLWLRSSHKSVQSLTVFAVCHCSVVLFHFKI